MVNKNKHSLPLCGSQSDGATVNQMKSVIIVRVEENSMVIEEHIERIWPTQQDQEWSPQGSDDLAKM